VRDDPDVGVFASRGEREVAVMMWHYHDDDVPGPGASVSLRVAGLPPDAATATLTHYRIDDRHSNAYSAWTRMGSPVAPNRTQYAELEAASELALLDAPRRIDLQGGAAAIELSLPRQAVSLVVLQWP